MASAPPPQLVFVNQHYLPDVAATGQLLADLAEHLAARGLRVRVICGRGRYVRGRVEAPANEERGGVEVRRVWTPGLGRGTAGRRILEYAAFLALVALRLHFGRRPTGVVFLTTPPLLPVLGATVCRLRRIPYAIWAMDLHPDAEVAAGMLAPRGASTRALDAVADAGLERADFVIALGRCMHARLEARGVRPDRIHRLTVWARGDQVQPLPRELNPTHGELGLPSDAFVIMYSGNAGLAHEFGPLLEAARRLRHERDVHFLFVGDGPRRREIEAFAREHSLERVVYRDYVERGELGPALAVGDAHFVSLRSEFAGISVPGKLYGSMAAGRPVLFLGPAECETGRTVRETGCGAVVDPASDPDPAGRIVAILRRWRAGEAERLELGRRGREAFLRRYERTPVCNEFDALLRSRWPALSDRRALLVDTRSRK